MTRAHTPTPRLRECRTHAYVSTPAVAKGFPMYFGKRNDNYGFLWRGDKDFLAGEPWSDMVCLGVKAEEVQKHG